MGGGTPTAALKGMERLHSDAAAGGGGWGAARWLPLGSIRLPTDFSPLVTREQEDGEGGSRVGEDVLVERRGRLAAAAAVAFVKTQNSVVVGAC